MNGTKKIKKEKRKNSYKFKVVDDLKKKSTKYKINYVFKVVKV